MFRHIAKACFIYCLVFFLSEGVKAQSVLRIAVASSTKTAVMKMIGPFQLENQSVRVEVITGSSGKLAGQIENGAPYHVLLSADYDYAKYLYDLGYGAEPPIHYTSGSLIFWTTKTDVVMDQWSLDTMHTFKSIAQANPETAPYGKLTSTILARKGLTSSLEDKIKIANSIAQVNQYVLSGTVDAGFTAKSTAFYRATKNKGTWVDVPDSTLKQYALINKQSSADEIALAVKFMDFLTSATGQNILIKTGHQAIK